jgi:hypothetical protein
VFELTVKVTDHKKEQLADEAEVDFWITQAEFWRNRIPLAVVMQRANPQARPTKKKP